MGEQGDHEISYEARYFFSLKQMQEGIKPTVAKSLGEDCTVRWLSEQKVLIHSNKKAKTSD